MQNWCPGPDSNRHGLSANGFSYPLRLSPPRCRVRGLECATTMAVLGTALGPRRPLSTPASYAISALDWLGVASACARGFADFDGLLTSRFRARRSQPG